ncbi:MAG: NAD-dependent epimerase/dehydratase family protein [Ilumatobacteraceae bacterium]
MDSASGRRILITGMGGQLGSLIASEMEKQPWVGSITGIDSDPPRRRLDRCEFHRIDAADADRTRSVIHAFDPHVLIHVAVWEPDARAKPRHAEIFTRDAAHSVFAAARSCASLEHVVIRSGLEVYGRAGGRPDVPDENAPTAPTTLYGRMLVELEQFAATSFTGTGADVTPLRLAPVVGPHIPSPLGRLLRMPFVPFNLLRPPLFSVLHEDDAARAFILAAQRTIGVPINVVGPGEVSGFSVARRSHHIPLPLIGPEWMITRRIAHLFGAPVPDHVMEVLHHGRRGSSSRCRSRLQWEPQMSTEDIIDSLFTWEGVVRIPPKQAWEVAT